MTRFNLYEHSCDCYNNCRNIILMAYKSSIFHDYNGIFVRYNRCCHHPFLFRKNLNVGAKFVPKAVPLSTTKIKPIEI